METIQDIIGFIDNLPDIMGYLIFDLSDSRTVMLKDYSDLDHELLTRMESVLPQLIECINSLVSSNGFSFRFYLENRTVYFILSKRYLAVLIRKTRKMNVFQELMKKLCL